MRSAAATPAPPWSLPPEDLPPLAGEIHVWRATLSQPEQRIDDLLRTLGHDERQRADSFHFKRDRDRFVVARGVLRAILGRYCRRAPDRLRFSYSPFGKPSLDGEDAPSFNVSHSHDLALYAVGLGCEIGIDVEFIRTDFEFEEIAEHFFSRREVAVLRGVEARAKPETFFNCWTRKEAYIKALGEGLSHPLHQFAVSMLPGEPAALLNAEAGGGEISAWSLQDLKPGPGYAAALAVREQGLRLKCYEWPWP